MKNKMLYENASFPLTCLAAREYKQMSNFMQLTHNSQRTTEL